MKKMAMIAVLATLFASVVGVASAAETETATWGVVDMNQVESQYEKMQELNQEFQDFQIEQQRRLTQERKSCLLDDAERQEFKDTAAMGAPTEERTQRLAELEKLANDREEKLLDLREKEDLTEEEQAEMKRLNALYERRMRDLASLQNELQMSVLAKRDELSNLIETNVSQAIESVAEEQELSLVLRKDAVLHGGVDLTEAVVTKLNGETEE